LAVSNLDFTKQVQGWADATGEKLKQVFHESTIDTLQEMQKIGPSSAFPAGQGGRMPVDTGWLRASIRVVLGGDVPSIDPSSYPPHDAGENSIPYDQSGNEATIMSAELGTTIAVGYTAAYAELQEYGSGKSPPRAFVGVAVIMWPSIVQNAVGRVKGQ
jgi:hypothetical protein